MLNSQSFQPPVTPGKEVANMRTSVQEIQGIVKDIKDIFEMVVPMIQQRAGNQQGAQVINSQPGISSTPAPHVIQKENVVYMEFDEEKVKGVIRDLIVNQAQKLPDEIKNKKILEMTGEEFLKFKHEAKKMGMSITFDAEGIIQLMSSQIIEVMKQCQKVKKSESQEGQKTGSMPQNQEK